MGCKFLGKYIQGAGFECTHEDNYTGSCDSFECELMEEDDDND